MFRGEILPADGTKKWRTRAREGIHDMCCRRQASIPSSDHAAYISHSHLTDSTFLLLRFDTSTPRRSLLSSSLPSLSPTPTSLAHLPRLPRTHSPCRKPAREGRCARAKPAVRLPYPSRYTASPSSLLRRLVLTPPQTFAQYVNLADTSTRT